MSEHRINESADKIVLKAEVKRGTGTRDQDKIKVKVKDDDTLLRQLRNSTNASINCEMKEPQISHERFSQTNKRGQ